MFKHIQRWAFLVSCALAVSLGAAQTAPVPTTEQTYRSMRFHELLWKAEPPSLGGSRGPWVPDSENFDEMFRLRKVLEERAGAGDAAAMFYVAVVKYEAAAKYEKGSPAGKEDYESALRLFKQAGAGGVIGGYWNVALMYANGEGVMQSNLAAAEWFYKAGAGYVAANEREQALAALEAIQKIDKNHALAKRLEKQLRTGAPK